MEQIIINKKAGGEIILGDRENVVIIESAEQRKSLLAENVVNLNVKSAVSLPFSIGDWASIFGETYKINSLPVATKTGNREFSYEITLESVVYDLLKVIYLNVNSEGLNTGADFSLMGNVLSFMEVLIYNLERVFPETWELGDYPETEYKNLTFSNENSLAVLQRICEEFGHEFQIVLVSGKYRINIKKIGQILPYTFEYGKGNGLYELTRLTVSDKNIVTRLYAFGAEKNLKPNYRGYSNRLKLPAADYIEDDTAKGLFGLIEGSVRFEDIFPSRVGEITALGENINQFVDISMDFDLNEKETGSNATKYLIAGTTAKINFLTGNLAGYEFELSKYNHATKSFTLVPYKSAKGFIYPNSDSIAYQFEVGDKYVLLDIMMPDSYVTDAEQRLQEKAEEYLLQNSKPRVQYNLSVDQFFLKQLVGSGSIGNILAEGDYLQVKDEQLNIDNSARIKAFTRDILNPYVYSLELSDEVQATLLQRIVAENTEVKRIIQQAGDNLLNPARVRNTWKTTQELLNMVFDTSGYFDTENIRPNSIETNMLAVGIADNQLTLNIVIEPNYEGDSDKVNVHAGQLIHLAIGPTPTTWNIAASLVTLTSAAAYYIYANVEKEGTAGTIIFSTEQIKINDDGSYYHFLIGILHSPDDGVRWISMTYGSTTINGRFIKTGRVQSADGQTYFDLDEGKIVGRIQFGRTTEATVIDEGVVASGSIILGEEGTEKAGITGLGAPDSSTRFWAGAPFTDRDTAPFRVNQGGEVEARKRIEVKGIESGVSVGQAGLNGDIDGTDRVRIWAGTNHSNRAIAPFQVDKEGSMRATRGRFGFLRILPTYIANADDAGNFNEEAMILFRYDPDLVFSAIGTNVFPATSGARGLARFENKQTNPVGTNYAVYIDVEGALNKNYGIYMANGILHTKEALLNGKRTFSQTFTSSGTLNLNPADYDFICIGITSGNTGYLQFNSTTEIRDGKEMLVFNTNDGSNNLVLQGIVRGHTITVNGGEAIRLFFQSGYWYISSRYDNNW